MTTYDAKDLIEQAQMLADLQNSDFISWKENMMFLDNAWSDLYQQIINHGDKSFLKTFSFEGSRCELPRDFYQLYYVCYSDGLNERPINRKSKTSTTNNGPFYDLEGDDIVVFNKLTSGRKVIVYYYPVRDSITFAADDQKVDGIDGNIIDVCDKNVLYSVTTTEDNVETTTYYVKDIINGTEKVLEGPAYALDENGPLTLDAPWIKKGGKAFYMDVPYNDATYMQVFKSNGDWLFDFDVKDISGTAGNLWDYHRHRNRIDALTDDALYLRYWEKIFRVDLETHEVSVYYTFRQDPENYNLYGFKNNLYFEIREKGVTVNGELLIPTTEFSRFHGVMKEDEKTGYGILVDNLKIKSVYDNTELLFPNNVYYNYLAYKLASYYKIKQGADPSGVMAAASEALNTFYNTILKDTNEYVRIANVYAR